MKIVYFTEYSWPNIDGVWNRVYNEARYFSKKSNQVFVFSSNILKPNQELPKYETFEEINFLRFNVFKITSNASFWPKKQVLAELYKIKPDIIICNNRHPESKLALKYAAITKIPCLLVTHAPFLEKGIRNILLDLIVKLYDHLFDFNRFDKIIAISNWELPYQKEIDNIINKKQ